jgi:pyruvate/2-oxoglutarate/acetoin dehydrogenase E1 component
MFREAINEALKEEMRRDSSVFLMGEDIGYAGGVRLATKGLFEEFGPERVRDTPLAESGFVGAAVGAAITGMRPVAELMYSDFFAVCFDEIFDKAAKWRYEHGGQMKVPLTVRCSFGAFGAGAAAHSQAQYDTIFMHCPGLRVIVPSTPHDCKGLLKTAIRGNNPSIFFEHRLLYPMKGPVPEDEYTLPLGVADVKRQGDDVTVVATGIMVHRSLEAAHELEKKGITVEVIDPRTLSPLDKQTILKSVRKTGKLVTVEEGTKTAGTGAEIAAIVVDEAFEHLDAPIKRVAARDSWIPYGPLEASVIPNTDCIVEAIMELIS